MIPESLPIIENSKLAYNVSGQTMDSWYEPRPQLIPFPTPESVSRRLNLDCLQSFLNHKVRHFCESHAISHKVTQTANLYSWWLRSLRRPGENGPPETLPSTPTLSAGNPEETAVYTALWGLAEPSDEQEKNADGFIQAMGINLDTRKLPNKMLSVRQRCLRVKDFAEIGSFHNPVFNMDGNNYLGTKLAPADWVNYMLNMVEALGFDPKDMHITYHPGGRININREGICHQEIYIPPIAEANQAMENWFKQKKINSPEEHLHRFSPDQDPRNMGAVWGPGGNTYVDANGKQIYGPFGPHFEVFIRIGNVYYELANGIFKKYLAVKKGIFTLGADEKGVAQSHKGIFSEEEVATVSMEGVIGYERALALLDYYRKNVHRPEESPTNNQPWHQQQYSLNKDGPNVFAVPGTSTYAVLKYLTDTERFRSTPVREWKSPHRGHFIPEDLADEKLFQELSSRFVALVQLFHSGYSLADDIFRKNLMICKELLTEGLYLNRSFLLSQAVADLEKTVIFSDPEFFRHRRQGFETLFFSKEEKKEHGRVLALLRGKALTQTMSAFFTKLESSKRKVQFSYFNIPEKINSIFIENRIPKNTAINIWRYLIRPISKIYSAAQSYGDKQNPAEDRFKDMIRTIKQVQEDKVQSIQNPRNGQERQINKALKLISGLAELRQVRKLDRRRFFPDNISYPQKLLILGIASLDRYFQLLLLRNFAFEYRNADNPKKNAIEVEIQKTFYLASQATRETIQCLLELAGKLSEKTVQTIWESVLHTITLPPSKPRKYTLAQNIQGLIGNSLGQEGQILSNILDCNAQRASRAIIKNLSLIQH